jgi:VIT family protein
LDACRTATRPLEITAGLAEIAAGAIAMGLGGNLATRTDVEHYESELRREIDEIAQVPETERSEGEKSDDEAHDWHT